MSRNSILHMQLTGNGILPFSLFLFLVYYFPVILVWTGVIPFEYRFHLLVVMTIAMMAYASYRKYDLNRLGLGSNSLVGSLIWNTGLSVAFGILLYLAFAAKLIREPTVPSWTLFYFFYVFISSPAQEFLYRSMVFAEMNAAGIRHPIWTVTISAVTFCFLHIIYNDVITLVVTLSMGVIWGVIYSKYPNFWGVTLSHAVLGVVSIAVGLI